jgi:hypothetical protein
VTTDDEIGLLAGQRATTDSPLVTVRDVRSMSAGLVTDDPWADRNLDVDPERWPGWRGPVSASPSPPARVRVREPRRRPAR